MKIKYVGNFTDGTGWAKASTYNALALHHAGYDVYCSEHKYNDLNHVLEPEITELLEKKSDSYDAIVQHVLPMDYKYYGGVKNIGFVVLENTHFTNVSWLSNIKMMDEMLVPNKASQKCLEIHGIKSRIFPHTFNFDKVHNTGTAASISELANTFNFVFIGDFCHRKNIEALLRAFHTEFDYIEPVNLYIKTWGKPFQEFESFCNDVKAKMKKQALYKKEVIVCDYLPEEVMLSTLKQCHAFVMPSRGEAWCYPAMEAMALGIPPIYTAGIGVEEYAKPDFSGLEVKSHETSCFGAVDTMSDLYTCEDRWLEIDVLDLQYRMRLLYNTYVQARESYQAISNNCIEDVSKFNYSNCELIKDVI
jgi:glycosyltransferase involved in cell wall biosynthesis